jgi:hypothetical protein
MTQANALTPDLLHAFLRRHQCAVIATASRDGRPEAALMDIAVTPELEIIFETTTATRKFPNLKHNPYGSMVIGWDDNRTLQCDGHVDEPEGAAHDRVRDFYLSVFPEKASHEFWPGNTYFRLRPNWFRLSDYNSPRQIQELALPSPRQPRPPWFSRASRILKRRK